MALNFYWLLKNFRIKASGHKNLQKQQSVKRETKVKKSDVNKWLFREAVTLLIFTQVAKYVLNLDLF